MIPEKLLFKELLKNEIEKETTKTESIYLTLEHYVISKVFLCHRFAL